MSASTIYEALRKAGMTREGACGLIGNMKKEATPALKSDIVQFGMTKMTDEQYTVAADLGQIGFTRDSIGYGLCQWTYWSRKEWLLRYAKQCGVSVGDEGMQVQFCILEMQQDFPGVWKTLTSSNDLYECTRIVCVDYERPAVNDIGVRYGYAQEAYAELASLSEHINETPQTEPVTGIPAKTTRPAHFDLTIATIQFYMSVDGYWLEPDGKKSAEFFAAARTWLADAEKC